jgi:hypothetical protein
MGASFLRCAGSKIVVSWGVGAGCTDSPDAAGTSLRWIAR